jgi:MFS family permease
MKKETILKTLYITGFIFAFHTALILYSNSSFLEQFIPKSYFGIIYSLGSLCAVIGLVLVPKIINKLGSRITLLLFLLLTIGICIINAFVLNPWIIASVFVLLFSLNIMFFLTNDIIIDQVADSDHMGSIRGTYLTMIGIGYVIAPTISGFILARMGFPSLYIIATITLVPLIFIIINTRSFSEIHTSKINIWHSLGKLFKTPNVRNIVMSNFILQFFYAWMVIYTPVYLHETLQIPWDTIGHIFSIMLLAFVLTEVPFGKLADKWFGEKYLLIAGFVIMAFSTSLLFFLHSFTLPIIALVLFMTRIGASCIEVLTESYFFKNIPKSETGTMSIFKNTYPVAYIIAPLIGSVILSIAPFRYLFLVLGCILFLGIFCILPINNTK